MQITEYGDTLVVVIDPQNCAALWKLLEPKISPAQRRIVLDFTQVSFINSVNIAQIIAARQRATAQGAEVRVAGLKENIRSVFRILRLDRLFSLDMGLEAALAKG